MKHVRLSSILMAVGLIVWTSPAYAQDEPQESIPDLTCVAGNCQHGVGIAEAPDGRLRYEGEWRAGIPHGYGRLFQYEPAGDVPPSGLLVEATFQFGDVLGAPRMIPLGPDARPESLEAAPESGRGSYDPWAGRALRLLLRARSLLPPGRQHDLARAIAATEYELAQEFGHIGVGGGDPAATERARVHFLLSMFLAESLGNVGADLVTKNAEALRHLESNLHDR